MSESHQSLEDQNRILDLIPLKIFTASADGETSYMNHQWAVYTGLPVEEVLRIGWREFVHPEDLEEKTQRWTQALKDGQSFEFEHRLRDFAHHYRWHLTRAEPLRRTDGNIAMWIGSNTDIHDLKCAQLELSRKEERFRTMADASPILIWMADSTKKCTFVNQRWLEFTGAPLDEELDLGLHFRVHPDDAGLCADALSRAYEKRRPFQAEYRLQRNDGQYRWVLDRGQPLHFHDGSFRGYIGGCVDIHDLKELENRLREAESRSRLAVESAGLGVWEWVVGGELKWSPEHNRMLGLAADHPNGTYQDFINRIVPEDRQRVIDAFDRTLATRDDLQVEFRISLDDGSIRWISEHGRVFYDEETGVARRILGASQDVTDRKRAEELIRINENRLKAALAAAETAREEAESASRTKDQFLAVLSHELRTPLTPVLMGLSSLRAEQDLPESVRNVMGMIQRNIKLEARLIDDLLDLTRIVQNKLEFKMEPMHLHEAIEQALEICKPDGAAKAQNWVVDLKASNDRILGDFARLQQVFWNLIKNAVKFTPENGTITISSRNGVNGILLEFSDTGVGISQSILPRIFRPFEQGDEASVRQLGGLGLGLAISKQTIEAHGGKLFANSAGPGRGSTFTISLSTLSAS